MTPITEFAPEPMLVAENPEKRSHARGRRQVTETRRTRQGCRGTVRGTSIGRTPVRCVHSGQIPETLVQVERTVRPSSPLLIRGFGVRVPGGAPVLNCSNSLLRPAIMAWRGTNSRTVTAPPCSTGAIRVRPTRAVPLDRAVIATGSGGGICRNLARVLRSCSYRTGSGPVVISDSVPMFEEAC